MPSNSSRALFDLLPPHAVPAARRALEQAAFRRVAEAVAQAIVYAPSAALRAAAAGAPSLQTAASMLSAAAAAEPLTAPLAGAAARGAARKRELLEQAGGALTRAEAMARTGVSYQTISNWRRRGAIIAIPRGARRYGFPACQFLADRVVPGLDRVLVASFLRDPWAQLGMLLTPAATLEGQTPLEALRAGEVEAAVAVARDAGNPLDENAPAASPPRRRRQTRRPSSR